MKHSEFISRLSILTDRNSGLISAICALFIFSGIQVFAQTAVSETMQTLTTYPFSDPTPVALLAPQENRPSYPYFRFDGYTNKPVEKQWKVVTLENPYISLSILPEVGGKIWGAVEKESGNEFIYTNHVMKFRDIALRGAWTSGGIEFNFGILGHVPTTATPIDYTVRQLSDSSASCYVASYDWITGAWWQVEINLPPDKAWFTTSVTWFNAADNNRPCYQWMNAAYSVRGNAEFIYPGNAGISHSGNADSYPITKDNKDISWYKNIDFGKSLSVHVLGNYSHFYGIYWHDKDFGSAHMAEHADKLGMKYFIWSTARSGAIWEELLTDNDGQYIEQQSGRMFCQPDEHCALTPFWHTALMPSQTDTWVEYWFPVKDIGGIKQTCTAGVLNVTRENGLLKIAFCPLQKTHTRLLIYDADSLIKSVPLQADVLKAFHTTLPASGRLAKEGTLRLLTEDRKLIYSELETDNRTNRPIQQPADIDHNSTYGLYSQGVNWVNQKRYNEAEQKFKEALQSDRYYLPALTSLAAIYNMQGRYQDALDLCITALSINTYDGDTNYQYALAAEALSHTLQAKDGFAMAAARDIQLRSAAYMKLSNIASRETDTEKAASYVNKALQANPLNLDAKVRNATLARQRGDTQYATHIIDEVLTSVPLFPPAIFEKLMLNGQQRLFRQHLQCEFPDEILLQLADQYTAAAMYTEAEILLSQAQCPIATYHYAWLRHLQGKEDDAITLLRKAQSISPQLVFPHRLTTLTVMQWADSVAPAWQNNYYAALILFGTQQREKALQQLALCNNADFAPLFLTKATLQQGEEQLESIKRSEQLQQSWRCGRMLINYYLKNRQYKLAVANAKKYHRLYPDNYYLSVLYANALCSDSQYDECIRLLENTTVLPYEGATEGHDVYRDAWLGKAEQLMKKGKYKDALNAVSKAKLWPENLGVGKPYDNLIDYSKEDALEQIIKLKMK
ncbi:MAG: DUF5107 domain-containing protein [Paludibacteraceae bacterium]|nr:DUF5107 domain-containing protein [Paludibacteraceae bacterium]